MLNFVCCPSDYTFGHLVLFHTEVIKWTARRETARCNRPTAQPLLLTKRASGSNGQQREVTQCAV